MKYTDRIILFIDLLGFKAIVKKSATDEEFLGQIYEILQGITSDPIAAESFQILDRQLFVTKFPPGMEKIANSVKEMAEFHKQQAITEKLKSSLLVTHFSDSLVLSADLQDQRAITALLEVIAKITFRLWDEYNILTRGGVTIGQLVHEEGGVLIGPAMVRAYELESTLALYPRILIDENATTFIHQMENYKFFSHLFKAFDQPIVNEKKKTSVKFGLEINLATSYAHFQNGPFSGSPLVIKRYDRSLKKAVPRLEEIRDSVKDEDVLKKYDYIIQELKEYSKDYPYWDELLADKK